MADAGPLRGSLLEDPARLPLMPAATVRSFGATLAVAPHQDDESLGCGGAIALLRAAGLPVHVLFVSDGSGSHPGSRQYPPPVLADVRECEARAALRVLGVDERAVTFLRLPDRDVPRAASAGFGAAVERVRGALATLSPPPATIFVPWRRDPHTDHRATWELVTEASAGTQPQPRLIEYPIWVWVNAREGDAPRPNEMTGWRLDIADVLPRKLAAIAAHRSQTTPLIADATRPWHLRPEVLSHFSRPWEVFLEESGRGTRDAGCGMWAREKGQATQPFDEQACDETGRVSQRRKSQVREETHPSNDHASRIPHPASLPPHYFDALYAESADPWGFETRPYEAAKYQATLAALPREQYASAFEIGCSIGVLTVRLAARCRRLLAVDVAERALAQARQRCRRLPHVRFARMQVPRAFPNERFDLVLVSEVGYYWSPDDLAAARRLIVRQLVPGGHLLLVHWTPVVADYPLTGDQVHDAFVAAADHDLRHLVGRREPLYRLDLFERQ